MDEAANILQGIVPDVSSKASKHFWDASNRGRFEMPRCIGCGALRWYPQPICPHCHSRETEWTLLSGRATLFSFTRVHRAFHPSVASWVPFVSILVLPEEDSRVRFVSRLVEYDNDEIHLPMALELAFHRLSPQVNLPFFRPAQAPR
jgi:uncharacterized OB-fold protein